jgi:hypothetical protein
MSPQAIGNTLKILASTNMRVCHFSNEETGVKRIAQFRSKANTPAPEPTAKLFLQVQKNGPRKTKAVSESCPAPH